MRSLRLSLLGGFQAHDAEGRRIPISGNKVILLLAYLALRAGEPQTREKLMALLWGERGESQARGSLRQALWTLRRALKGLEPSALIVDKEVLALDPLAAEIDTLTFASLIEEGSPEALQAAIGLYRGQLLEGVRARDRSIEDVLADERRRLHELAIEADVKLLEHWSGEGADEKATAAAKHLLPLDPMDETAHRALMRMLIAILRRRRSTPYRITVKKSRRSQCFPSPTSAVIPSRNTSVTELPKISSPPFPGCAGSSSFRVTPASSTKPEPSASSRSDGSWACATCSAPRYLRLARRYHPKRHGSDRAQTGCRRSRTLAASLIGKPGRMGSRDAGAQALLADDHQG
jgi:DNA-binding SARP family transcriptional activator